LPIPLEIKAPAAPLSSTVMGAISALLEKQIKQAISIPIFLFGGAYYLGDGAKKPSPIAV
jgi:hypothetical protein